MPYQEMTKRVQSYYDGCAQEYRRFDEDTVDEDSPRHTCQRLRELTESMQREIRALDLGCGCGRSFHCLSNVGHLVGMDVSLAMLKQASHPVRAEHVRAGKISLVCADFYEAALPPQYFDFAYSIGMLGEHIPFTLEACHKLYDTLKPGGILFFTAVDRAVMREHKSLKRQLAELVYPALHGPLKEKWQARLQSCYLLESELRAIMDAGRFARYEIVRHECKASRWQGAHFECTAFK